MTSPVRPVVLKFVFGKGMVKRRRESDNTSRFIAEQMTFRYAEGTYRQQIEFLKINIMREVRAELNHLHNQFAKFILNSPASRRRPQGRITTVAQSPLGNPSVNLGSKIPHWIPRGEEYVRRKTNKSWFANEGLLETMMAPYSGEIGQGGTLFEEIFGPVSVTIRKNLKGWGAASGSMSAGVLSQSKGSRRSGMGLPKGMLGTSSSNLVRAAAGATPQGGNTKTISVNLATVEVRALGKLNPGAIGRNSLYGPSGAVSEWNQDVANRLGGRHATYRPSLEPFLDFFFEKSLGHAVSERIRRGLMNSSLTRAGR